MNSDFAQNESIDQKNERIHIRYIYYTITVMLQN